ncbi:early nodulin-12B-like isoform X1 [Actinidia eriantha]|uniref:early nodulin-12B-like isoform X1 n=1 Tax=Actinidia eriantha TaxID=165200 RepID=UPI00258580D5|nr:early nodulin-12B-like isoform X1 [Actinidia eriantha]
MMILKALCPWECVYKMSLYTYQASNFYVKLLLLLFLQHYHGEAPAPTPEKHHPPGKAPAHSPKPHVHPPVKPPVHPPGKAPIHPPMPPVHPPVKAPAHSPKPHVHPPVKAPISPPRPPAFHGCSWQCSKYCKGKREQRKRCQKVCTVCCSKSKCVPGKAKVCTSWGSVIYHGRFVKCP